VVFDSKQASEYLKDSGVKHQDKVRIMKIRCGLHHNLAMSEHGLIFAFGQNSYGQIEMKNQ